MNPPRIKQAKAIARESRARRVVIIASDDELFSITTWGATLDDCRALAQWAESEDADRLLQQIVPAATSIKLSALLPGPPDE